MSDSSRFIRRRRASRRRRSSAITSTSSKNLRDRRGELRRLGKRLAIALPGPDHGVDRRLPLVDLGEERDLGRLGQQRPDPRPASPCSAPASRFLAMFRTRLNSTASCWKSAELGELGQDLDLAAGLQRAD